VAPVLERIKDYVNSIDCPPDKAKIPLIYLVPDAEKARGMVEKSNATDELRRTRIIEFSKIPETPKTESGWTESAQNFYREFVGFLSRIEK